MDLSGNDRLEAQGCKGMFFHVKLSNFAVETCDEGRFRERCGFFFFGLVLPCDIYSSLFGLQCSLVSLRLHWLLTESNCSLVSVMAMSIPSVLSETFFEM